MSRFAVISDVHGNLAALEAVLTAIRTEQVDDIICLGDVVGYGPQPDACINVVTRHCAHIVQGNHDEAIIDPGVAATFNGHARAAIDWTRTALGPLHMAAICQFPTQLYIGADTLCVHDTPNADESAYLHGPAEAAFAFSRSDRPICLVGHTHVPMVFEAPRGDGPTAPCLPADVQTHRAMDGRAIALRPDRRYICNPGSVGQPHDADPRASFAILDLDTSTFTVRRTEYDIVRTQIETQRVGLPLILARRLAVGA